MSLPSAAPPDDHGQSDVTRQGGKHDGPDETSPDLPEYQPGPKDHADQAAGTVNTGELLAAVASGGSPVDDLAKRFGPELVQQLVSTGELTRTGDVVELGDPL